jgi:hypothetical protein
MDLESHERIPARAVSILLVKQSDYNGSTGKNNGSAPYPLASLSSAFAPAQSEESPASWAKWSAIWNAQPERPAILRTPQRRTVGVHKFMATTWRRDGQDRMRRPRFGVSFQVHGDMGEV